MGGGEFLIDVPCDMAPGQNGVSADSYCTCDLEQGAPPLDFPSVTVGSTCRGWGVGRGSGGWGGEGGGGGRWGGEGGGWWRVGVRGGGGRRMGVRGVEGVGDESGG